MVASRVRFGVLTGVLCAVALAFLCALGPRAAFATEGPDPFASGAAIDLPDGVYSVDVAMEGGSGRASIDSPALLTVKGGHAAATIRWSSSNYDYMLVGGEKFLPVNEDPMANSEFQIPVLAFDEPFDVVGDTTAMSSPHEVSYTLAFALGSVVEGAPATAVDAAGADTSADIAAEGTSAAAGVPAGSPAGQAQNTGGLPIGAIIAIVVAVVVVIGIVIGVTRARKNR